MVNATKTELLPPAETEVMDDAGVETDDGDQGADEAETGDDDGDDDGLFYYAVTLKNGLRSFHEDDRDPDDVAFDFKVAVTFPCRPDSLFSDKELVRFEQLQREDPKRYGEKTARAYLFQLGDAILDPREVAELCPADDLIYVPEEQREAEAASEEQAKVSVMPQLPAEPPPVPAPQPLPAVKQNGRLSRLGK
jgi:hypothetical protein